MAKYILIIWYKLYMPIVNLYFFNCRQDFFLHVTNVIVHSSYNGEVCILAIFTTKFVCCVYKIVNWRSKRAFLYHNLNKFNGFWFHFNLRTKIAKYFLNPSNCRYSASGHTKIAESLLNGMKCRSEHMDKITIL